MITDSYHGSIFSIIFKKPFITYLNKGRGNDRFFSLIKTFNLSQRIIDQENFEKGFHHYYLFLKFFFK